MTGAVDVAATSRHSTCSCRTSLGTGLSRHMSAPALVDSSASWRLVSLVITTMGRYWCVCGFSAVHCSITERHGRRDHLSTRPIFTVAFGRADALTVNC